MPEYSGRGSQLQTQLHATTRTFLNQHPKTMKPKQLRKKIISLNPLSLVFVFMNLNWEKRSELWLMFNYCFLLYSFSANFFKFVELNRYFYCVCTSARFSNVYLFPKNMLYELYSFRKTSFIRRFLYKECFYIYRYLQTICSRSYTVKRATGANFTYRCELYWKVIFFNTHSSSEASSVFFLPSSNKYSFLKILMYFISRLMDTKNKYYKNIFYASYTLEVCTKVLFPMLHLQVLELFRERIRDDK